MPSDQPSAASGARAAGAAGAPTAASADAEQRSGVRLRAIRGAVTAEHDKPAAIYRATRTLLSAIVERNELTDDDIISVIFTVTPDLTSAFPALAARQMGWLEVPLLCTMEIPVPGALERCIRVLVYVESARARSEIQHVYLGTADVLRPDLSLAQLDDTAGPAASPAGGPNLGP